MTEKALLENKRTQFKQYKTVYTERIEVIEGKIAVSDKLDIQGPLELLGRGSLISSMESLSIPIIVTV